MNETIEGRAPGGHGGDANGIGRVRSDWSPTNKTLSEGSSPYPGQEIKPGSTQWETKRTTEALPSDVDKVDFDLHSQTKNNPHPWALHRKTLVFIDRTADESKVPNFLQSGRTSYTLPSVSECQRDYSFKPTPTKARTTT